MAMPDRRDLRQACFIDFSTRRREDHRDQKDRSAMTCHVKSPGVFRPSAGYKPGFEA